MNRKNLRSLAAGVALLLAVGALAGCGGEKKADDSKKMVTVGIAQLVEHGALDAANKGFVAGMASKGFKENENVKYDRQNAQADQSNLQNIAQRFVSNKVDLICAIATPTAQTMANATKDIPIVATAVTDYEVAKLAGDKGINVIEATVSTVNDIQQAAHSLVGKVDAVYVPTDNVMASSMPTLVAVTDEARLPVICGESDPVRAGGLATLGIDYYKLGEQTGVMAAEILSGKGKPQTMPVQMQKEFKVVVNETTAKRNGITIPQDILAKAEIVK